MKNITKTVHTVNCHVKTCLMKLKKNEIRQGGTRLFTVSYMYLYVSVRSSRSRTDPYGWPSWFPLPGKKYQIYLGRGGGGGGERFGGFHCLSLTAINTHAHPPSTF